MFTLIIHKIWCKWYRIYIWSMIVPDWQVSLVLRNSTGLCGVDRPNFKIQFGKKSPVWLVGTWQYCTVSFGITEGRFTNIKFEGGWSNKAYIHHFVSFFTHYRRENWLETDLRLLISVSIRMKGVPIINCMIRWLMVHFLVES